MGVKIDPALVAVSRATARRLGLTKPGSRIVSHDFDMGDWTPDRVVRVQGDGRERVLYLWTVPARP